MPRPANVPDAALIIPPDHRMVHNRAPERQKIHLALVSPGNFTAGFHQDGIGQGAVPVGVDRFDQGVFVIGDLVRWEPLAIKKPFFRLISLNFSPKIPDFGCKICLSSRKNGIFRAQSPSPQQVS